MKTNCERWKYLLCVIAVTTAFVSIPFNIKAADITAKITDGIGKKQEATLDKMNSADKTSELVTTAGAANVLDAEISMNKEELITFARNNRIPEVIVQPQEQSTFVMANVNQYVNIRQDADQDSEKLGVLYKDCGGDILERKDGWTKLQSGDVIGWVKNEYLYFGKEAEELAKEVGILTACSNTETLRVRKEASTSAGILGLLANGEAVEAIAEEGDWVKVSYEGATGYVSAEYVKVTFDIDTAESMETIRKREEEAAKAAEKARAASAKAQEARNVQKEAVLASATELEILGALIQCEAGGEPYEGQVAVGAVVMNRVRCSGYPNTITEVIYASGQFAPASKGKMESLILNKTTNASCMQAAQEAINGRCNVGDALHFRRVGNQQGLVIGNHVFW